MFFRLCTRAPRIFIASIIVPHTNSSITNTSTQQMTGTGKSPALAAELCCFPCSYSFPVFHYSAGTGQKKERAAKMLRAAAILTPAPSYFTMNTKGVFTMSRDSIKMVAMLTMLINHIANVFLPAGQPLTNLCLCIGYFTAVTMCFFSRRRLRLHPLQTPLRRAAAGVCRAGAAAVSAGLSGKRHRRVCAVQHAVHAAALLSGAAGAGEDPGPRAARRLHRAADLRIAVL